MRRGRTKTRAARPRRGGRVGRWLVVLLGGLALLLLGLVLFLQTGWARELLRQRVNVALAPLFQGRIEIEHIGRLGLWGVADVNARVFDGQARQVIAARGLTARAALPQLLWQVAFADAGPRIDIDLVRVDHVDVTLREHAELGVTLADTFLPREQDTPDDPQAGPGPELRLPRIELGRVWAHGRAGGSPPLDVDLVDLHAGLSQGATGFELELERATVTARALPGDISASGTLWGSIDVPDAPSLPLRLEGYLDGRAASSPLWLEAVWTGDDLHALVRLPSLQGSFLNERIAGLELEGDVSLLAEAAGTLPELDVSARISGPAAELALDASALLDGELQAFATLSATHVNLQGFSRAAPRSDLSLRAQALVLEEDAGSFTIGHRVELDAGSLDGLATPAAWVNGRLALVDAVANAAGAWAVAEPGAATRGSYELARDGRTRNTLTLTAESALEDPPRLQELGVLAAGRAVAEARLQLDTQRLDAKLDVSLGHVDYRALQTRHVELRARASGPIDAPRIEAATTLDLFSGRAHADLAYDANEQRLALFLADIDALRLARSLGLSPPLKQGNLNADVLLRRQARTPGSVLVDGKLRADFGRLGGLHLVATELNLPLEPTHPTSLATLRGQLTARGKFELDQLPLSEALRLERTTGTLRFELTARNRASDAAPEVSLLVDTNGLRIVERRPQQGPINTTGDAIESDPFALEGIDAHASLRFLPASGEAVGTIITRDRGGTLAKLEGELQLAQVWRALLEQPRVLLEAPCRLHLEVPSRRLQSLPPLIRPAALRGRVELDAELSGSLADPRVRSWLTLNRLRTSGSRESIDVSGSLRYAPGGGQFLLRAIDRNDVGVGSLTTRWQGDLRRVARQPEGMPPLVASVEAALDGFPLAVVPPLVDRQIKGRLSGKLALRDWGKNAELDARLDGRDLTLGGASLPSLRVMARSQADSLLAEIGVTTGKGAARASIEADADWGASALPELRRRGLAKLSARRFELATLTPLLGAYVSELSGMLNAEAQVAVSGPETRVAGSAELERGVIQLPAIGQRFSDISARVAVSEGQFKLQNLSARGLTGRLSATGAAELDGFALRSAEAHATIEKNEMLPLTLEGVALGDVWGDVRVAYTSPAQGERSLKIEVPELHLITPENAGRGLQSLASSEDVRVGTRRADGTFVELPVQPLEPSGDEQPISGKPAPPLRIQIELGKNVTVARGRTAQAQLTGRLVALSDGVTRVTGRIEVRGGKLDVQGKTFEIERGLLTFDGKDPSNPTITATARWDGPDYAVYADYVGDVENGRIKLRAEPPLTQDQIASLLLFGDPDGSVGGNSDPNSAALAVMVAGDTAAKGLNQVLSDFTKLDVRARVDTSTGAARPELLFQVSPRVVARVTRAIGEPAVGESPDRTFLTLELKLKRAWALSAVFGDHGGSALDLIWRHRY